MSAAKKFIKDFNDIHPLPHVVSTVTRLINDPESSIRDFEEVIQTDPILVSRLLRLVNSSYFGLNQKVDSISRAVAFLGMKNLHSLVVTDALKNIFDKPAQSKSFSKQALWTHSSAVSICSKMVAERIFSTNGDDAFLCGILHDFGLLVEEQLQPDSFYAICDTAKTTTELIELEQQSLGTNHCEICHLMTQEWNMSPAIQGAILNHHHIFEEIEPGTLTGIIQISEYLVGQIGHPQLPDTNQIISPDLMEHLKDNIDEYTVLLEDLPEELEKAQEIHG